MKYKKYKVDIPEGMKVKRELWPTTDSKKVVIEFEPIKKELPKTWEEFYKVNDMYEWRLSKYNYNKEIDALRKLLELRDHYNDGWKPDWENENQVECSIFFVNNKIATTERRDRHNVLSFKTAILRAEFLLNFRELINEAKPLL